jgi:alpha-L-fucosidase 2
MNHNKITFLFYFISIIFFQKFSYAQNDLKLWYDEPATDWMTEALPLGNGYLGAMFFGGIPAEHIQFTEESLWAGGPGSNSKYNFGIRQSAYLYLDIVRQLMWTNKYEEAHKIMQKHFTGEIHSKENSELEFGDFGSQQTMGDIFVQLGHGDKVENYRWESPKKHTN